MSGPTTQFRFQFLDVFRGLAIAAVMLFHFMYPVQESGYWFVDDWLWPLASHGYLGVQLFFVISGYCISAAIYSMQGKRTPLRTFFYRRARRIFPPYWSSLLLAVVLAVGTMAVMGKTWASVFPMTLWDWVVNAFLLQMPFDAPDAILTSWSLSIEIQFYLIMGICLFDLARAEFYVIALSLGSMLLLVFSVLPIGGFVVAYWGEFACGIAAFYWITRKNRWRWTPWCIMATVALTAAGVWRANPIMIYANGHVTLPVKLLLCMILTVVFVKLHAFDERLSGHRWARIPAMLGGISYTLYLTHVPLATRVLNLLRRITGVQGIWWVVYISASCVVTIVAGLVFYRFCEKPWLNSGRQSIRDSTARLNANMS